MNSEKSESKGIIPKKSNKAISILKFIGKGILAILLILSIIFQLPWKVIALLAIVLVACTILPKKFRKWFWLSTVAAILILAVWIFIPENNTGWRPYTFDKEIADYKSKYEISDQENALTVYSSLINKYDNWFFDFPDTNQYEYTMNHFWETKEYPELANWLAIREDVINILFEGSKKEKCRFPIDFQITRPQIIQDILPTLRYSTHIAIQSANNDTAENRIEKAIEKYICILRISKQICTQTNIYDYLYGTSIQYYPLKQINRLMVEKEPTENQLQGLSQYINNLQNNWETDFKQMLDFDSLFWKSNFARTYEINDKGRIRISRNPEVPIIEIYGHSIITGRFIPDIHPHKFNSFIAWFYLPRTPQKLSKIFQSNMKKCYQMAEPDFNWNFEKSYINLHFSLNFPDLISDFVTNRINEYSFIHERYLKDLTIRRGTYLVLRLQQYKNEHGTWPDSLDEIKSDTPAEAFIDPATGKQLQYKKSGEDFTLSGELINIWPYDSFN